MITPARIRALLSYDPATGILRWRERKGSAATGRIAGSRDNRRRNCVLVKIDGRNYSANRLIAHAWRSVNHEPVSRPLSPKWRAA